MTLPKPWTWDLILAGGFFLLTESMLVVLLVLMLPSAPWGGAE